MRISAMLGTRDEAELLGAAVAALLRAGVGRVAIVDDRSTDATPGVIRDLLRDPRILALPAPDGLAGLYDFAGPLFGPLIARDAPDWILCTDSDEFLLARGDAAALAAELARFDVLEIARFNAAPGPDGIDPALLADPAALRTLPLVAARQRLDRATLEADPSRRWITHAIVPKLMLRPAAAAGFLASAHNAAPRPGRTLRRGRSRELLIVHLPFTDYPRFARKVRNIADLFARFGAEYPGLRAWHWKHWVTLAAEGRLREEFDRQLFDPQSLAALRAEGGLATAEEIFAHRAATGREIGEAAG